MCLLHPNELPLRPLFKPVDGATSGSRGFSGSIRKWLLTCSELPVFSFKPVTLTEQLSSLDVKELSTDQQHFFKMCNSINTRQCSTNLVMQNP